MIVIGGGRCGAVLVDGQETAVAICVFCRLEDWVLSAEVAAVVVVRQRAHACAGMVLPLSACFLVQEKYAKTIWGWFEYGLVYNSVILFVAKADTE